MPSRTPKSVKELQPGTEMLVTPERSTFFALRADFSVENSCFFFQAEDGIRVLTVTGVQTCALPITWPIATRFRHDLSGAGPRGRGACRAGRVLPAGGQRGPVAAWRAGHAGRRRRGDRPGHAEPPPPASGPGRDDAEHQGVPVRRGPSAAAPGRGRHLLWQD